MQACRNGLVAAVVLVAALVPVGPMAAAGAAPAAVVVAAYPGPGTTTALPATTISVRGVTLDQIGSFVVLGSVSGSHPGTWSSHPDGDGASFTPNTPFTPGETVTVRSSLVVQGANSDTYSFTIAHPSAVLTPATPDDDVAPLSPLASRAPRAADTPTIPVQTFATRPDLLPPVMTATAPSGAPAPGLIATTPRGTGAPQIGPMLLDKKGQVVWWQPITAVTNKIDNVLNAAVQHYHGKSVLTWWQGQLLQGFGFGEYEMRDSSYRHVGTIHAGNGLAADLHDMQITPNNTALLIAYNSVSRDLSAYGGPASGTVLDAVVQEVDIPTGDVLFQWDSLDHIALGDSHVAAPTDPTKAWDYLHPNALELDTDGNIILSGRHTWGLYKIARPFTGQTLAAGTLIWTMGQGKDFTPTNFASNEWFAWQHDVRRRSDGHLSVFDNASGPGPALHSYSRGWELSVDEANKTVTSVRELRASPDVLATSQGAFRSIGSGHDLIGWGSIGQITEFADGNAIVNITFPAGVQSYRSVPVDWHATPTSPPDVIWARDAHTTTATVSWNGATDVSKWVLRAGPDFSHLASVYARSRTGFETTLTSTTQANVVVLEARNANDNVLGSVSRVFVTPLSAPVLGYAVAQSNGTVSQFGAVTRHTPVHLHAGQTAVGIAPGLATGYWVATADGDVAAIAAPRLGSLARRKLKAPIVGIASTADGLGYWLVASDGGVFAFGTAHYFGSLGGVKLNKPIVGIAGSPDGRGYLLVASDGGVFAFGDTHYRGSLGGVHLNAPIVGIAMPSDTRGYWLVASDGGVFAFGNAHFDGSLLTAHAHATVQAIATMRNGRGYWLAGTNGGVYAFGEAPFLGNVLPGALHGHVVGIVAQ